jgi:hypothetical protein
MMSEPLTPSCTEILGHVDCCGAPLASYYQDEQGIYLAWCGAHIYKDHVELPCPVCDAMVDWRYPHAHHPAFIDRHLERKHEIDKLTNCE